MRKLLYLLPLLFSLVVRGQIETQISVPYTSSTSPTFPALLKLPDDYATTSKAYPLLICLHGSGESCPPLSNIYNSASAGMVPYLIEHGQWPASTTNPADGQQYKFIVVSPQSACNSWSTSGDQLENIIKYLVLTYRVDINRIYGTGLSSGGGGVTEYAAHLNGNEDALTSIRTYKFAAFVPMSLATLTPIQSWGTKIANDTIPCWGLGDQNGDTYGSNTQLLMQFINNIKPGLARFTGNPPFNTGHGPWAAYYAPTYRESITSGGVTAMMNIYEWMLTKTRSNAIVVPTPTADAGSSQSIILPTSTVTLNGSNSHAGAGHTLTGYLWSQLSGPTCTISTPTTVQTSVINMTTAGTYLFKLTVTDDIGQTASANVSVVVNTPLPYRPCGSRVRVTLNPAIPGDSGVFIGASSSNTMFNPGDTVVLKKLAGSWYDYSTIEIDSFQGNPACPLVIINSNAGVGQPVVKRQIKLESCTYAKITGSGDARFKYGIKIMYDPTFVYQGYHAIEIRQKSKSIMVDSIWMRNVDMGIVCEGVESCDSNLNFPKFVIDSMDFHDNLIQHCWNEGMYIGNTSPDNASFDLRPVQCNGQIPCSPLGGSCINTYPAPPKNGYTHIWNNIVDSTGRGGIQVSNAGSGVSEIAFNSVHASGINGDDAQGGGITLGLYTRVWVHDNNVVNTYTWGITSLGAGATNIPIRYENNRVDSSGYLKWFNLATTSRDHYDPLTEPNFPDTLVWPYPFFIDTKTRLYTTDSPHPGTAIRGQDSTQFWIKNNLCGLAKATNRADGGSKASIQIQNDVPGIQFSGNVICNNKNFDGSAATIFTDNTNGVINYSTSCAAPPTVSAGTDQVVTLPTNQATLTGTASGNGGATIQGYGWSQVSGPNTPLIVSPTLAITTVTGLIAGTYQFRLVVTDSNLNTNNATVNVFVNPVPPVGGCGCLGFILPTLAPNQ